MHDGFLSIPDLRPNLRRDIGHGITLHYVEQGTGTLGVFVHGSLSDGGYWVDQIGPFAKHYRAIAYSRRYNYRNVNPARPGYSAVVDAEDLAAFIHTLHLGTVVVIGHSYGACTIPRHQPVDGWSVRVSLRRAAFDAQRDGPSAFSK